MDDQKPGDIDFLIMLTSAPLTLWGCWRLTNLSSVSEKDEALLATCALLFLQMLVEQGANSLAFHVDKRDGTNVAELPLRDRLRALDVALGRGFFDRRSNIETISRLDRLISLRSRIAHAKSVDRRLVWRGGEWMRDVETGEQISASRSIARAYREPPWRRLSAAEAKVYYRAVLDLFASLDPQDTLGLAEENRRLERGETSWDER